jgi:hypothetical protein
MAAARQKEMKDSITVVATTILTRLWGFIVSAVAVESSIRFDSDQESACLDLAGVRRSFSSAIAGGVRKGKSLPRRAKSKLRHSGHR